MMNEHIMIDGQENSQSHTAAKDAGMPQLTLPGEQKPLQVLTEMPQGQAQIPSKLVPSVASHEQTAFGEAHVEQGQNIPDFVKAMNDAFDASLASVPKSPESTPVVSTPAAAAEEKPQHVVAVPDQQVGSAREASTPEITVDMARTIWDDTPLPSEDAIPREGTTQSVNLRIAVLKLSGIALKSGVVVGSEGHSALPAETSKLGIVVPAPAEVHASSVIPATADAAIQPPTPPSTPVEHVPSSPPQTSEQQLPPVTDPITAMPEAPTQHSGGIFGGIKSLFRGGGK